MPCPTRRLQWMARFRLCSMVDALGSPPLMRIVRRHVQIVSPISLLRMIRKVLIADHGEVAIRLLSEFAGAGVKTVAVYTVQDCNSEHVRLADEAICIGKTLKSYHSDWHRIISAAEISEVDAIHPGD